MKKLSVAIWIPGMNFQGSGHLSGEHNLNVTLPEDNVTLGQVKQKIQDELIPIVRERVKKLHRETLMEFGGTHLFHTPLGAQGMPVHPLHFTELGPDESRFWEDHGSDLPLKKTWRPDGQGTPHVHFYVDLEVHLEVIASPSGNWPAMDPDIFIKRVLTLTLIQNYWETSHIDDVKRLIQKETGWDPLCMNVLRNGRKLVREQKRLHVTNRINRESIFHPNFVQHRSTLKLWIYDLVVYVVTLGNICFPIPVHSNDEVQVLQAKVIAHEVWKEPSDEYPILVLSNGTDITGAVGSGNKPRCTFSKRSLTLAEVGVSNNCIVYATLGLYNTLQDPAYFDKGGIVTPKAECRGITLIQLRELATAILMRCHREGWRSTNPKKQSDFLSPDEVTLYDLMEHFIVPITSQRQCSYVELVAKSSEIQSPKYFCSHWWGEPVLNFLACVEQHALDRDLPATTSYWVCAYALNQHDLSSELNSGGSHKDTPFYKAIQSTDGTLLVLDDSAIVFNRIWCVYELFLVFNDRKEKGNYAYDIYTIPHDEYDAGEGQPWSKKKPVGLTDGPVVSDGQPGYSKQWERQSSFPMLICNASFGLRLERARASLEEDRHFILNSIIGHNQSALAIPPKFHPAFDNLNCTLKGRFAQSAYRTALENGHQNMQSFRQALSNAPLKRLDMDFSKSKAFCSELGEFCMSLPSSLESLSLNLSRNCWLEKLDEFFGLGLLVNLKSLELDFKFCSSNMKDCEPLWNEIGKLLNLRRLQLDMTQCGYPRTLSSTDKGFSVHALGKSLNSLSYLEILTLLFSDFRMESVDELSKAIPNLPKLSSFTMELNRNSFGHGNNEFSILAQGLSFVRNLRDCSITLHSFPKPSYEFLVGSFWKMPTVGVLERLNLSLSSNKIDSIKGLARALRNARKLLVLKLNLACNFKLDTLDELGDCFAQMPMLRELNINAYACRPLSDIDKFSRDLQLLQNLEVLSLSFGGTAISSMTAIEKARKRMKSLKKIELVTSDGSRYTHNESDSEVWSRKSTRNSKN